MTRNEAPPELLVILETVAVEDVIATIEALHPDWMHSLLPWRIAQPGERIPWQAVFCLFDYKPTAGDMAWAQRKIIELGLSEER